MQEQLPHTSRVSKLVTRLARIAVIVVLAIVLAPRVQAMMRPSSPATEAMVAATSELTGFETSAAAPSPVAQPRTERERLINAALSLRGAPYKWGAKGPDEFDCSGFTKAAYAAIGVQLPDGSFNQAEGELPLASLQDLAPGDLLFYRWPGEDGVTHVTLYAGDGWMIGTGSPGQVPEVVVYPLTDDLKVKGTVITYRHTRLADETE